MYPPQGTDQPALHRLRHFHSKKSHKLPKAEKKRQNLKKDFATTSLKICLYIQTPRGLHIFLQGKRKGRSSDSFPSRPPLPGIDVVDFKRINR